MCDPMSALAMTGTAIQIGSTVMQHAEQETASVDNENAAREQAANSMRLLGLRQEQEKDGTVQTLYQMDLEARRADAMTRVAAGEAGVAGSSVDALLGDIERQRLMADAGIRKNSAAMQDQLNGEKKGVRATRKAQINSVAAPNPYATGIKIGGSVLDASAGAINRRKGT